MAELVERAKADLDDYVEEERGLLPGFWHRSRRERHLVHHLVVVGVVVVAGRQLGLVFAVVDRTSSRTKIRTLLPTLIGGTEQVVTIFAFL